jgi:hypothetical protein
LVQIQSGRASRFFCSIGLSILLDALKCQA